MFGRPESNQSPPLRFALFRFFCVPLLLLVGGVLIAGCDTAGVTGPGGEETTTISGTVTGGGGSKSLAATSSSTPMVSSTPVANATVSAVRLKDDGSVAQLDATTKTESDGSFELKIKRQPEGATIVVKAEKSGANFSSSVGVQVTSPAATEAQPMTPETDAEAQVARKLNAQAGDAERAAEALADAAALVDNDVAKAILSGETAPSNIASLARSMDEAAEDYANDAGASIDERAVAKAEANAYEKLQAALATASDSADRAQALNAFEKNMASSYEEAGASQQLQAEITQTGTQVALSAVQASSLPTEAQHGLARRATVLRAIATGSSVEKTISNNGTGSDVSGQLNSARQTLLETVRSASSVSEIQTAVSEYRSAVKDQMATGFNMSGTDVQKGFENLQSALDTLKGALDTAMKVTSGLEVNADAVSNAFQKFYTNGVQAVKDAYSSRGMPSGPSQAAAKVTAKISVL